MPTIKAVRGVPMPGVTRLDRPAVLALGLVAAVFAVDLALPLGVAAAVPYTFAVLAALKSRRAWLGPAVACLCVTLTIAKVGLVPERGTTEAWKVALNRALAAFAVVMTAVLGLSRRRAELRVREREADLARVARLAAAGETAAVLAHELNQPLAAACVQADVAARLVRGPQPPEFHAALEEVVTQSRRAAEMVRTVRRMVRRGEPGRAPVDLNAVAREAVRLLDWRATRGRVAVGLELCDPPPVVSGDAAQLEQLALNLLQNAIEAVESVEAGPRRVTLRTSRTLGGVRLAVRDTGRGLADPEAAFERFATTKPDGMGLGLAIARAVAEAHGGRLTGADHGGGGAEFVLDLPAPPEEPA